MKYKIKQLKLSVLLMLMAEAIITITIVFLASLENEEFINLNFIVGYAMFFMHILFFAFRRKAIIKRFNNNISENKIFAAYMEKRSYVQNSLVLYTSFFVLALSMLCNVIFLFINNESSLPLDLLSLLSASLVISTPFLGRVYRKIVSITQTEGDMKRDAIKKDIKYCVFNSLSLQSSMNEIETTNKTINLIDKNDELDSNKIIERLQNRIKNIQDEISLFENYLLFESTVKTIKNDQTRKKLIQSLVNQKEMSQIFKLITKHQK